MTPDIGSHLHRMRTVQNAEILHYLIRAAVVEIRRGLAVAHAQEPFDVEHGKALFIRSKFTPIRAANFESHDPELLDTKIGVLPDAELLDIAFVPAETNFIDQSWAERVNVLGGEAFVWKRRVVEEVGIQLSIWEVPRRIDVVDKNLVARAEDV